MNDDSGLPDPAPAFASHFTDPIYEDVSNDMTPFGGDEAWDMLYEWSQRREELGPESSVADVLEADPAAYADSGTFDDAIFLRAAGFTLLRLTGHIDAEGKQATISALDKLMEEFGETPELLKQREDLENWSE